jgi:hypothetical protein
MPMISHVRHVIPAAEGVDKILPALMDERCLEPRNEKTVPIREG